MPFHYKENLKYLSFDSFDEAKVQQVIFTRHGGVSPVPWKSLNLGGTVGDEGVNVTENRRRCFSEIGRSVESSYDVWQVHGTEVICTDIPRPSTTPHKRADAILTDCEDITLFMRFADCVPILLSDPVKKVIGIVHAGWMGTVEHICSIAITTMQDRYGCSSDNIIAGIGPSICVDHYPIGDDVSEKVKGAFGEASKDLLVEYPDGKMHFNLWDANRIDLEREGVKRIEVSGICTAHSPEDWYSHRFEKGKTGRFGAFISLGGKS